MEEYLIALFVNLVAYLIKKIASKLLARAIVYLHVKTTFS